MKLQSRQAPRRSIAILAMSLLGWAVIGRAQDANPALTTWGPVASSSDRAAGEAQKRGLAEQLVARTETSSGRSFDPAYRRWLVGAVAAQSLERLEELSSGGDQAGPILNVLGDSAADLVYTPVTPCRVFDTRFSVSGILGGGTQQNFLVAGASGFSSQGGNAAGCGIPFGPATSVIINFAAVTPAGPGNLRAWAVASPQPAPPLAAVMNFSATLTALANGIAVPVCNPAVTSCTAGDLRLQADVSSVHVVGDVVGYFALTDVPTVARQFDGFFQNGVAEPAEECASWDTFRASLAGSTFTRVTIYGSAGSSTSCTNPASVAAIRAALQTGASLTDHACDGRFWNVGTFGAVVEVNSKPASGGPFPVGDCGTSDKVIRPCIANANWGGIGSATCGAPSQNMSIRFED